MSVVEEMGDQLARDVLEACIELGDDRFYEKVSKVLLDASPTMQEAFLTAVRVRLAERRARVYVEQMLTAKRTGAAAPRAPVGGDGGH